jgi:CheY-like chemotaxis protein
VAAANELARANETLERRVRERTAEILRVNAALAVAKAKADEANLDKTRFLAAASHDLLQPLNAARLYTSSLVERHLSEADAAIAHNIDASLGAVEEILSALIDISRMDAGRLEPEITDVPLADLFAHLKLEFEPLAREAGLELRVVPTSLWVRSDRRLLRRVLQNLVVNAVKYTNKGSVLLGARRRNGSVMVQVTDTGRGIPSSQHELVFKEFQRLEDSASEIRGLGLGLSIVERICRVLDVPISLNSRLGRGSTFSILLPRAETRSLTAAPPAPAPIQGPIAGCVALCIDNEPAVLEGMETLLAGWGCKVLTASSGKGALDEVSRASVIPDIILADYRQDNETGLDAVTRLREAVRADIPTVFITADHSPEVERELRARGFALLRKPLKAAALRAVMTPYALRRAAAAE